MKNVTKMAAQGDVVFVRVLSIPKNAVPVKRTGPAVVAHSETGHHHVIKEPCVQVMTTDDPLICYLRMEVPFADVEHMRPFDTHETLRLVGDRQGESLWCVRRQREYTPDGWRMVQD